MPAPESVCFDRFGNLQCDASPICVNLFYQCRICSEGDVFCSINELKVCHSNRWVVEEVCGPKETCDETAKACLIKIDVCENYCLDEHTLLECQKNGDYVEIPCSLGCLNGICRSELGCTPETYQCIDNKLMKCSEQRNWDVVAVCAQSEVCNAESMECINPGEVLEDLENELCIPSDGSVTQIRDVTIAKLRSAVYGSENDENANATIFSDFEHHLMGFVGSGDIMDVEDLLAKAGIDESSFLIVYETTASVTADNWLEMGDVNGEQVIPDFDISRYHIELTLNHGETLEEKLASLGGVFGIGKSDTLISETTCADDQAIFYLSRSDYEGKSGIFSIYNGVLGCASIREEASSDAVALAALGVMDDVISGSLTVPKKSAVPSAAENGYVPFVKNNCQTASFEKISRAVDFLWVVDNSRSMEDKQQALAEAIPAFLKQLKNSGLDYRVAVTTTDAYTLDETAFKSFIWVENDYDSIKDGRPVADTYINGIGIRNGLSITSANSYYPGFISKPTAIIPVSGGRSYFTACITSNSRCVPDKQNVCGSGYEDGLRSGTFVLSRLAVDTSDNKESVAEAKAMLNPYDLEMYDEIVDLKKQLANGQFLKYDESNDRYEDYSLELSAENVEQNVKDMKLRSDALKYIIWLSDEESRQFGSTNGLVVSSDIGASACANGNKLVDGMMKYGNAEDGAVAFSHACNPNMYLALETAIAKNIHEVKTKPGTTLLQDMSLDELRQQDGLKAYTDMLDYYLKEYRRYAGTGGIVGFSIVGDIGKQNGGICDSAMACSGTCYADAEDQTGHNAYMECSCYDCKAVNSEYRNTGWSSLDACVGGANYGLSYIHMARFLGLDEGGFEKEGGFASICDSNFDSIVNAIFEDVVGRVQTYSLRTYPIASTIRVGVALKNKGKTIELVRGAGYHGFSYDAASNSITFVGISDIGDEYSYVISYDSWSEK